MGLEVSLYVCHADETEDVDGLGHCLGFVLWIFPSFGFAPLRLTESLLRFFTSLLGGRRDDYIETLVIERLQEIQW